MHRRNDGHNVIAGILYLVIGVGRRLARVGVASVRRDEAHQLSLNRLGFYNVA